MAQTEMAVFVHGDPLMIDYTPNADVATGDIIDLGAFVGIAHRPIASGVTGALSINGGVYDVLKHGTETFAIGDVVYWDVSDIHVRNNVSYSDAILGVCVKAATSTDTTVRVAQVLSL